MVENKQHLSAYGLPNGCSMNGALLANGVYYPALFKYKLGRGEI